MPSKNASQQGRPQTAKNGTGGVVLYQPPEGRGSLEVRLERETVWLTQRQMADLFGKNTDTIGLHIRNAFKEGELDEAATTEDSSVVHREGSRAVRRPVRFYNLDVIISVGYRVKSKHGTQFRIWATRVLREHLVRGLTINRQRLESNAKEIEAALELVRRNATSPQLTTDVGRGLVEVIARYMQVFLWLQRYDDGLLNDGRDIGPKRAEGGCTDARRNTARLI